MSDVSMTTAAEPDGAPRLAVLDILRGIAILGILFMNINDMGQSLRASFEDIRHLGWSATDQIAWWLREVLANGTARCLLEMLFGVGMVILTDRAATAAGNWAIIKRYWVRNAILFVFGLVHIFILLWPGDILHTYGLAALVAVLFRKLKPRWLISIGLIMAALQLGLGGYFGYYTATQRIATVAAVEAKQKAGQPLAVADRKVLEKEAKRLKERAKDRAKTAADIAAEDTARKGGFMSWARAQWWAIIEIEGYGAELLWVWEASSVMLIGAALYRLGIIQGLRARGFYVGLALISYAVGVTLRAIGAWEQTRFDSLPHIIWATSEVARLSMTLGHVALVNLLVTTAFGAALLRPFVAAGRTALSIYIAQTLVCLWVLYPPFVLGLYGKMTWGPLMLTALVVNTCLLIGANIWVRHFDIAPVEWAWRSLVERRVLPWRKRARPAPMFEGAPAIA